MLTIGFPERRLIFSCQQGTRKEGISDVIYHGDKGLADITVTVRNAVKDIGPYKRRFDFIAVTGMSGALVGSPVAIALSIPLVVVRKHGDNSHSWRPLINGDSAYGRYLFLDDFISVGSTFRRLVNLLDNHVSSPEYAGAYLYESRQLSWDGDGIVSFSHLSHDKKWAVSIMPPFSEDHHHLKDAA